MTRNWATIVRPEAFRLLAGEADLKDYQPDAIHHVFCKICGVRSFAWGDDPAFGGKFYGVRISCLKPLDVDELMKAPVTYYDGLNDDYASSPAEIRHL